MSRTNTSNAGLRALAILSLIVGLLNVGHGGLLLAKAELGQVLLQQAWTRTVDGQTKAKPWPWADTWPVARLSAPRLAQSNIVLSEAGGEALAFGPAWLDAGAAPGTTGPIIVAAHRNTHFAWLKNLKAGDTLWMQTAKGGKIAYEVTNMEVVRFDASGIEADTTSNTLDLVTCYPFLAPPGGPLRYVVHAKQMPNLNKTPAPNEVIS